MKNFKRFAYSFSVSLSLLLAFAQIRVFAQGVQDFRITNFSAVYELTNDNPQGLLDITETVEVDFSGQNRGILRAIPEVYRDNNLNVRIVEVRRDGNIEPFITYSENNNRVVRIGDADTFITGQHRYSISYRVENVINFYDDYDELYWDINGTEWLQPFDKVAVTLRTNARSIEPGAQCFTGSFGSTDQNCEIRDRLNGLDAETTQVLSPSETLTIVQTFEKGYFTPPSWWQQNWQHIIGLPVLGMQILVVRKAHRTWEKYGKDYPKRGVTAPYFGRPKDVSVMQASYVHANRLLPKHVSASIIDLAIRGFIQITEKGSGRKVTHELTLKKPAQDKDLSEGEKKLLSALFKDSTVDSKIELEKQKYKLSSAMGELLKIADKTTYKKGYYELSPKNSQTKSLSFLLQAGALLFVSFGLLVIFGIGWIIVTAVLTMVAAVVYASHMSKRSHQGNMLVEHMEGLKLYLGFSEKDRLAAHDAVEAPLARNAHKPVRDVKFFEKLLPFAVAMGVEKTWANAFADVYEQPPEWYGGNWNTFTTAALVSSVSNTVTAATATFTAPSSSGGSGSGGGGFSGGGGGGGGGGGW